MYVALVFFKIEVYLIYNVVSISGIQQSDSVIQIYIYISYIYIRMFSRFFSILGYYKNLNIVPCAI